MTNSFKRSAVSPQPVRHGCVSGARVCHGPVSRAPRPSSLAARRSAFTLVEIVIVFAIIAVLVVIITMVTVRARDAAKVKQTHAIMNAIKTALNDYKTTTGKGDPRPPFDPDATATQGGTLPPSHAGASFRTDFYREKDGTVDTWWKDPASNDKPAEGITDPGQEAYAVNLMNTKDPGYAADKPRRIYGIQALYYYLMSEPSSKALVNKIPASSIVKASVVEAAGFLDVPGDKMSRGDITVVAQRARVIEVLVFVDAWGRPMYYGKHNYMNNGEAYLQSAGPDGEFSTDDDIFSFKE